MKYKIKLVCIFMMLMISSVFVNANVLNKQTTENNNEENLVNVENSNLEFETTDVIFLETQLFTIMSNTWIVDNEGDGDFTNIQDAIDDDSVQNGDTIMVYSGTYIENVVVDKELVILGQDEEYGLGNDIGKPLIDGNGVGDVILVSVQGVTINGFSIQNSGNQHNPIFDSGIKLLSVNNVEISNNIISINLFGIIVKKSKEGVVIDHNLIINNNADGIGLIQSKYVKIYSNNISNQNETGIYLGYSSGNKIINNTIFNNYDGIYLFRFSRNNDIAFNNISYNKIYKTTPTLTGCGIFASSFCSNNKIYENDFLKNERYGINFRQFSQRNTIYWNNFADNIISNMYIESGIYNQYTGTHGDGNYWDDWIGWEDQNKENRPYIIWVSYGPIWWPQFDWNPIPWREHYHPPDL